jgi:ABC-type lipoprotein release transport system permease subunit
MARRAPLAVPFVVALATTALPAEELPEVLLSRQAAAARGLAAGDVVKLAPEPDGAGARAFRIAGIYEPLPDPFRLTVERMEARLHLPDLLEAVGTTAGPAEAEAVTRINVALHAPGDASAFTERLASRVPGLHVLTTTARRGDDPFVVLERFHIAIAVVTVIGSTAFLMALMLMRADERRETAGILRLLGLSRGRVLAEALVEGLWVALVGTLFGLALARVLETAFNGFFQWRYDTALIFVRVTPGIALRCVAIALPLGVLAGALASWSLLRRETVELLRR